MFEGLVALEGRFHSSSLLVMHNRRRCRSEIGLLRNLRRPDLFACASKVSPSLLKFLASKVFQSNHVVVIKFAGHVTSRVTRDSGLSSCVGEKADVYDIFAQRQEWLSWGPVRVVTPVAL